MDMKKLTDRIVYDPKICSGKPCIKGTRIPVHIILDLLAAGESQWALRRHIPILPMMTSGRV